jgi:hypothetical protein
MEQQAPLRLEEISSHKLVGISVLERIADKKYKKTIKYSLVIFKIIRKVL